MEASLSFPLLAPQPLHRQIPMSSSDLAPGGAWPLTNLHFEHIKANLFFEEVSSSPSNASKMRSYHLDSPNAGAEGYEGARANAFGANSADGAVPGLEGDCGL